LKILSLLTALIDLKNCFNSSLIPISSPTGAKS
jgi:hypothetical protein